jgi:hypothetical protein
MMVVQDFLIQLLDHQLLTLAVAEVVKEMLALVLVMVVLVVEVLVVLYPHRQLLDLVQMDLIILVVAVVVEQA